MLIYTVRVLDTERRALSRAAFYTQGEARTWGEDEAALHKRPPSAVEVTMWEVQGARPDLPDLEEPDPCPIRHPEA